LAYLVFTSPDDRAVGQSYRRNFYFHRVAGVITLGVRLIDQNGGNVVASGSLRFTLDGSPITDPVTSTTGAWSATWDTRSFSDGSHLLSVEGLAGHAVIDVDVTIDNTPGALTGPQRIALRGNDYDLKNSAFGPGGGFVDYEPGRGPRPDPLVPRVGTPYSTRLPPTALWVERMATSVTKGAVSRFYDTPEGHITVSPRQLYHWYDKPGSIVPGFRDGPRNVGQMGFVWAGECDRRDGSFWGINVGGQVKRLGLDGQVTTVAGKRLKADRLMPYNLEGSPTWPWAWHEAHFELVGHWHEGPAGFSKPWDVIQCPLHADDWYVADTMNHRVCRVETYTGGAHVETYCGSLTRQAGFVDGPSDVARFNQPWGMAMVTVDPDAEEGSTCDLYINDRENNALRVRRASGQVETVIKSIVNPTNAMLQVFNDDDVAGGGSASWATELRRLYLKDGPFGACSYLRPEALRWANVERTALISVERYTFAARRIDLEARTVTTLALLPVDANTRNPGLAVDTAGVVGPVGDILVTAWGQQQNYRLTKDGIRAGAIFPEGATRLYLNGPLEQLVATNYASGIAIGPDGAIWCNCVGSEQTFRITQRLPSDPRPDPTAYSRGDQLWRYGSRPNMRLIRGEGAQDQIGGPVAKELAGLSDADLAAVLAPLVVSPADLGKVRHYLTWNALGTVPPDSVVLPVIGAISARSTP
jgi:hypothetical protein